MLQIQFLHVLQCRHCARSVCCVSLSKWWMPMQEVQLLQQQFGLWQLFVIIRLLSTWEPATTSAFKVCSPPPHELMAFLFHQNDLSALACCRKALEPAPAVARRHRNDRRSRSPAAVKKRRVESPRQALVPGGEERHARAAHALYSEQSRYCCVQEGATPQGRKSNPEEAHLSRAQG